MKLMTQPRKKPTTMAKRKAKAKRKFQPLRNTVIPKRMMVNVTELCTYFARSRQRPFRRAVGAGMAANAGGALSDEAYLTMNRQQLYRSLFFRRQLTVKAQQMIVFRRYGSLRSFRRPVERISVISRDPRLAPSTIFQVLQRFRKNGYEVKDDQRKGHRQFPKIPPTMQSWLLKPETLQAWARFSLHDRVRELRRTHGLQISFMTLYKFYRHHRVGYHSTQYIYRSALQKRTELEQKRLVFAHQVASLIYAKKPIIYMDETR